MTDERDYLSPGIRRAVEQAAHTAPTPGDPWRDRVRGMRCASCMWFAPKAPAIAPVPVDPVGRCRRHAPTMNGYPVVFSSDWCGDHKLDENKA